MVIKELKQIAAIKMAFIRQQASLAHEYKKSTLLSSGQLQIDSLPLKLIIISYINRKLYYF
jgi:hypothetical protein